MRSNRSTNLRRLLSASALVLATSLACLYAPRLPPRISDEEIRSLGVEQGIAGRSAQRVGDCMPGCNSGCFVERVPMTLKVVEAQPAISVPFDENGDCKRSNWMPTFPLPETEMPVTVGEVDLEDKDSFALALDAGTYQVLLVDDSGCASCGVQEHDGGATCAPVIVHPGEVTHQDVLLNLAGE